MPQKNYKSVNRTSSNLSEEKLAELRRILPEAFSEHKIHWEKLRAVLGNAIDERIEKFSFTWAGKSNAIKNVLIPSKATLSPAKGESVKFNESKNLFIEGDNLEVLKLLQKAYFEQVKMIYIDPPYNTGGDFVYKDDFSAPLRNYLQQTGQVDAEGNRLQTNRETSGRYHSDWLSMMYPRLKLAWNLLKDEGVIFVSIDDNEVHHLRMLLNEVFGEENFVVQFVWTTKTAPKGVPTTNMIVSNHEYIVAYKKTKEFAFTGNERDLEKFSNPDNDPRGLWKADNMKSTVAAVKKFAIIDPVTGNRFTKKWAFAKETIERMINEGKVLFPKDPSGTPRQKRFLSEYTNETTPLVSQLGTFHTETATNKLKELLGGEKLFDFPKPVELVQLLVQQTSSGDDMVLDFFAGSGTTAHAVLRQNQEDGGKRKFILVQLPEVTEVESEAHKAGYKTIADIAKERIRRVIKGYGDKPQPIDDGFKVFKLTESNYPENQFEFDPEKPEEENKKAFEEYLAKAKQKQLFDSTKAVDVVYENIVKEGFSLNSNIGETKVGKNNVYAVADGERQLLVCLDKQVDEATINQLTSKDYKGKTFICLDSALNDTAKANLGLNVELKTI